MDPERQDPAARAPLDDAALAALVHDVADGWSMPPQRLDALTWRDRVGRGRRSSGGGGSGIRWTRRLFGAATLAVVATVSLSFAAVWLTGPRSDQGASGPSASASAAPGAPSASPGTSPTVSVPPAGTPLPQLARNGPLPDPSSVMVRTGGGFRVADLATGTLGPAVIGQYNGPTKVLARPGGGWVCLCGDWTQRTAGDPNGLRLTLEVVDATGAAVERRVLKELNGTLDPTEVRSVQPQLVDVSLMGTDDGQYAVIGTVRRDGATGWVLAIDMVDLSTLEIMGTHSLTLAEPMAHDGRARTRLAPVATLSPSGDTLLLTDMWYDDTGPSGPLVGGVDHWIGRSDGGATDPTSGEVRLVPAGSSSWADCSEIAASAADGGTYRTACVAGSGRVTVAHFRADGTTVDSTELPQEANVDGLALTAQTASALFIWDPAAAVMTRYDFGTGKVTTEQGQVAAAPPDVLDTIAMVGRRIGELDRPVRPGQGLPATRHRRESRRHAHLRARGRGRRRGLGRLRGRVRLRRHDARAARALGAEGRHGVDRHQRRRSLPVRGGGRRRRRGRPRCTGERLLDHGLRHRHRGGRAPGRSARRGGPAAQRADGPLIGERAQSRRR